MTRQEIPEQLQRWNDQAAKIMALFDDRGQRVPAAQRDLLTLKASWRPNTRDALLSKRRRAVTPDEQAFYASSVREACNALGQVPRNSMLAAMQPERDSEEPRTTGQILT